MIRFIGFILYFIAGLILSPFLGWFLFFATLADTWRGMGKKPKIEPLDLKLTPSDIHPDMGTTEQVRVKPETQSQPKQVPIKDLSIFYPDKGGRMWS